MLWLPKWLHESGERLEAEMPSRRTFLFMAAATVVSAVVPVPATPIGWDELAPAPTVAQMDFLLGHRMLWQGGLRGGKTHALAALVRAEAERCAVDPKATHGMVEYHGLIVPKHTPGDIERDRWWSQMYRAIDVREREFAAWARLEPSDVNGLGVGRIPEPDPPKNYHGITRRRW